MKQDSWEMFLAVFLAGGAIIWALLHDEKPKPPKIDPPTRIPPKARIGVCPDCKAEGVLATRNDGYFLVVCMACAVRRNLL